MVKPFVKRPPQNLDASPLLGTNEHAYASLTSHASRPEPANENIRLNVRILSRTNMPQPITTTTTTTTTNSSAISKPITQRVSASASSLYQSVVDRNRPQTQRSHLSTASSEMMMSPLVRSRPPSSWKRCSQMSRDPAKDPKSVRFSVTIGASSSTVEDLAHVIESAYATQRHLDATTRMLCGAQGSNVDGYADQLIICTALFKGSAPLLFSSNVGAVLQSGDTVTVYSGVAYEDSDDDADADDDSDNDVKHYAAPRRGVSGFSHSIGSSSTSRSGLSAHGDEFLFVPLTALPPIPDSAEPEPEPSLGSANTAIAGQRRSSALYSTIGSVNMIAVSELISQAPLKARFINVLVHPPLLRAFLEFCALPSELALESLLFVLDVERFRHVQPSMARLLANYIYLSYVAPSAPLRINISSQMRERIPWPFLPGWEYNPWVFDEILASVGFTLKKHTLLRFERSPVGLAALMNSGSEGAFNPAEYTKPLEFDLEFDPMVAIATHFEPDIDVVIWVNELEIDRSGAQLTTGLSRLTVDFREQLLIRVAAQFVDEHKAFSLCDGYFQLATHIKPLQKQRRIKKTRKIRNFFGDHPHEALLRQQLMAVVPPSSQKQAARAAAEVVARKKSNEAAHRRQAEGLLSRQGSIASSILAEQQILAMDSDSDIEKEHMHGWALQAMHGPMSGNVGKQAGALRERSWSSTDDDDEGINSDDSQQSGRINGWSTRDTSSRDHRGRGRGLANRHARMLKNNNQCLGSASPLRGNTSSGFKDQTLDRALSMIGVSHADSQGSSFGSSFGSGSSSSGSSCNGGSDGGSDGDDAGPSSFPANVLSSSIASIGSAHVHFQGIDNCSIGEPGASFYNASQSFSRDMASPGAADAYACASAIYERKRRVDKLREFFGGADPTGILAKKPSSTDTRNDTVRSVSTINSQADTIGRSSSSMDFELEGHSSALTAEQRNLLVRRRRKLRAILGEDCVGHQLMPSPCVATHAGKSKSAVSNDSALGLAGVLPLLPTPNDTSAGESSLSSSSMASSSCQNPVAELSMDNEVGVSGSPQQHRASGELEKLRDAQIRQFNKIREVLGDSAPAPFLYDLRSKNPSVAAAGEPENADPAAMPMPAYLRHQAVGPASVSEEQRMRARWRRNKLMTVLGDVPTNVTTLYRSDPSGNLSSEHASDSEAASETSGVFVQRDDTLHCDKEELALAQINFGTGAMPVGADPKGKQRRRRRVKKLKSFFGQSLSSEAMRSISATDTGSALLDTVAEEPETMSPNSSTSTSTSTSAGSSEQSYEFIPIRSVQSHKAPDWRLSLTQSQQQMSSAQNLGLAGIDSSERPFKAQFWVTASPDSQASIVTNEKTSRRTSLMATLKARKASIIGSIKRATPSTTSVNTQGLGNGKHNSSVVSLAHGLVRPRSSSIQSKQNTADNHVTLDTASTANTFASKSPVVSSPASSKLGFIARQINKVASASPKLGGAAHAAGPSAKSAACAHSSSLVLPTRSSSIKPLSPLPAISPNNFQASFDRGIALREMVAVAEYISNGQSPRLEFPPRVRSAAATGRVAQAGPTGPTGLSGPSGPSGPRSIHQQIISSALLSGCADISQISTRSSRNAFDESSSSSLQYPARQLHGKSVHWFDCPKPPVVDRSDINSAANFVAANSVAFPQPSSAKSSMDSVTMSIVLRSPSTKKSALISPIVSSSTLSTRTSSSSVRPSRSGTQPIIPIAQPFNGSSSLSTLRSPRATLSHKASVTAVGGRRVVQHNGANISGKNSGSNIVTIRARRSQSFAIRRKLEKATVGRKRSNTIGSGRQTDSRPDSQKPGQKIDSFPQADKQSRRVQSMIIEPRLPVIAKSTRNRCITVTPVRLELQRLMSRNRAARKSRKPMLRPIPEKDDVVDCTVGKRSLESGRLRSTPIATTSPSQKNTFHGAYKFSRQMLNSLTGKNRNIKRMSYQASYCSAASNRPNIG
ncbi:hypothetical protein GGF39_001867 [Coemansia sp. RSA 1721]|nr:hypothetical protein GGF39_001867 [Coemansia sp. RSA 1721]